MSARVLLLIIAFAACSTAANLSLGLSAEASCPGNVLSVNLTDSAGHPASGVELRLVLYLPYQGLRAIQHSDAQGMAYFELTKNGTYRIYPSTNDYDHPKYVEFDYPALCPPPPPKPLNVSWAADCDAGWLRLSATSEGTPLGGVFITTGTWSSLTGPDGNVSFPLEEGQVFIRAEKENHTKQEFFADVSCAPQPECAGNADCDDWEYCGAGSCANATGECGYAGNHSWILYECCRDEDCGNASLCEDNSCISKPPPQPPPENVTNQTTNQTGNGEPETTAPSPCLPAFLIPALFCIRICTRSPDKCRSIATCRRIAGEGGWRSRLSS
ncbi:MAG: hypothetical protein AB1529_07980 [Candidatus Micrarchaeota archaeon]